jgi:hypothetical protein
VGALVSTLDELLAPAPPTPGWPPELREHLSASSLRMLATCPEQFRRVYVKGERQRPGAALVWGSADHYAHEQNFAQKIDSHSDISVGDVELAFAEGFDRSIASNGGEDEVDWGEDKPGDLKDRGVRLAATYHQQVSPRVQPTAVEKPVALELGLAVPVVGRLDIETDETVIEGKTATAKKQKPEPQWRLQGTLYQLATGKPLEWHVKTKTKIPAVYTPAEEPGLRFVASRLLLDATVERTRRLVASMLALYAAYGPDGPWPTGAPDYGWACDYCGFRPTCAWWRDEPVALEEMPFGEPETEVTKLERLLLAYGRQHEMEEHIQDRIDTSRALCDDAEHVVWLKDQLAKAAQA